MNARLDAPLVSVVIPTFNRAATLDLCLEHLAHQCVAPTVFEVIVADDASTDDTETVAKRWVDAGPMEVRYVRCEKGFAGAARNRGSRMARAERLLFLGDDILAAPDLIEQHLAIAGRGDNRSVLVGEVTLDGPRPLPPFMSFLEESGLHHDFPTLHGYGESSIPGRYFYACNASLPRRAFEAVGGFDESIRRAWEDSELGCRLEAAGWSLRFAPAAHGVHVHPLTFKSYVGFRRRGRDDVARAAVLMRAAGEDIPPVVPHPVLDRVVGDGAVDAAVSVVTAVDRWLPKRLRHALYRRLLRYENRRALQLAEPS